MRDKLSKGLLALMFTIVAGSAFGCSGCEDEPKKQEEVVAATPTKEVASSGPFDKLAAPDSVVLFGGIDKPTALAGHLSELVLGTAAQGTAQLQGSMATVAARFGLKDASGLDATKPIRFAVVDPKANEQPFVLAIGTKSRDAFVKTLPEKHKKDEGGNAYSYVTSGMDAVFVNFIDDWAVLTGHKDIFEKQKPFAVKLIGATVPGDAAAIVEMSHVSKLYADDIDLALESAKKQMSAASSKLPGAGVGGFEGVFDWFGKASKELERVVLTSDASKDAGKVRIDLVPKSESSLQTTFKALGARKLKPILSKLPADAPAAFVASIDPQKSSELMQGLMSWVIQLSVGAEGGDEKYAEAMESYWRASNGDMAMVAHHFEDKLRMSMFAGVRDAKVARESMATLRGLQKEDKAQEMYKSMGLEVTHKADAYKVGDVAVDTTIMKLGKADPKSKEVDLSKAMGPMGGLFAELMSSHRAVTKDNVFMTYGADSKSLMTAWIEGKIAGGLDTSKGVRAALDGAAPGAFFMLYGSPLAVAQALQQPGGPAMPVNSGIALTAGATDGTVHVVLGIPGDQAKALSKMLASFGSVLR